MYSSTHTPRRAVIALPRPGEPHLVEIAHPDPGQRVRVAGRVDVHTVADVRIALREAVDHGIGELVVDVAAAELGDTTGLGVLLGAHRRAVRRGRQLVLLDPPASLRRLLVATHLVSVLHVRAGDAAVATA